MKHLILVLLALLLTGCRTDLPDTTVTQPSHIVTVPTTVPLKQPTEVHANRALSAYDTGLTDHRGIYPMGSEMLLISGGDDTLLTVLSGSNARIRTQKTVPGLPDPQNGSMQVSERGIAYYNSLQHAIVFLDTNLLEVQRFPLPSAIKGSFLISPDWNSIYYCSDSAIHALNLQTGIPRMIRRHDVIRQELTGLHLGGRILACQVTYTDGFSECLYLSTRNGEAVYPERELHQFFTGENTYFAAFRDGTVDIWLTGQPEQTPWMLQVPQGAQVAPLFASDALVIRETTADRTELSYLDITSGRRLSAITLEDTTDIAFLSGNEEAVWFFARDARSGKQLLYRWSPAWSRVWSPRSYYRTYYTADSPNTDELLRLTYRAKKLGDTYGINILIGNDALTYQPEDHTFQMEYRIAAYERDLAVLESALANFPGGFFQAAASGTKNRQLTVSLVRDIRTGGREAVPGKQYWLDDSAYIVLAMGPELEQTFYHQLCHIIDNRVMSTTAVYDNWAALNPDGIHYSYSYQHPPAEADSTWFAGETRAFTDLYATTFPREDRARLLELAMMPGNDDIFTSKTMQRKLAALCQGIRLAFDLEADQAFFWEQYLQAESK